MPLNSTYSMNGQLIPIVLEMKDVGVQLILVENDTFKPYLLYERCFGDKGFR